ncbi:MAG: glycosyltransferase family 2 protein [Acidimicrobiales bacterium]|nr:glycosyltransferase family 2 protein [Acidimicrobiales bacterium]
MNVIALIPAYDSVDRIAATVAATAAITGVTRVLVVDDGSGDGTGAEARRAGAEVLTMPVNVGKGRAIAAGVAASPDADVFLLVDADLAETAAETGRLLAPVLDGEADLAIAVLPGAGGRAGFGLVRDLAGRGIARACGWQSAAPLSGQRAVRAELLRGLADAERFGLEVAMTIDAARAGARIVEVEAPIEHRHTGRSFSGFVHRGRQGIDVVRSLWPRITTGRQRIGAIVVFAAVLVAAMAWTGSSWQPDTEALAAGPEHVVVFGVAPYDFDDVPSVHTPTLDRLRQEGAMGAMTVRTVARRPSIAEGYLSLGAGSRVRVRRGASLAVPTDTEVDGQTVAETLEQITGVQPRGEIGVPGASATIRANQGVEVASPPGALADALADAGIATAVVGVADHPGTSTRSGSRERPAALAAMGSDLTVSTGSVDPDQLLMDDPSAPFGVRSDPDAVLSAVDDALGRAGLVVVDPGDLQRASSFRSSTLPGVADAMRDDALAHTDELLGDLIERVGSDTLIYVVSVAPRGGDYRLTPVYATGSGVPPGSWITSPSTQRRGLVTLTDLAPTVLHALTGETGHDLPGNALRYEDGPANLDVLSRYDRETNVRERTYFAQAQLFIAAQALVYAAVALVVSRRRQGSRSGTVARWAVLVVASYPVSTFIVKAIPSATAGPVVLPSILAIAASVVIATLASRRRGHPLAGLDVVLALTVAVIVIDAATGTWLNVSSWLGYSLHSAGRFYGLPNSTFAVLGSAAILLAAGWMHRCARPREALVAVGSLFAVVVIASGLPMLGANTGAMLTLVPVFGLTLWALSGRPIRVWTLVAAGAGALAVLVAAASIDLLRPDESRAHLGRFAAQLLDEGLGPLIETYLRKQAANFRIFRVSIWTWMIPIVAGFVLYLLAWGRGWERLLPPRSALRIGAISVVGAALLGFAANDSGPIVVALFVVYLLPYLALLVLDPARERVPILTAPASGSPPPP